MKEEEKEQKYVGTWKEGIKELAPRRYADNAR